MCSAASLTALTFCVIYMRKEGACKYKMDTSSSLLFLLWPLSDAAGLASRYREGGVSSRTKGRILLQVRACMQRMAREVRGEERRHTAFSFEREELFSSRELRSSRERERSRSSLHQLSISTHKRASFHCWYKCEFSNSEQYAHMSA